MERKHSGRSGAAIPSNTFAPVLIFRSSARWDLPDPAKPRRNVTFAKLNPEIFSQPPNDKVHRAGGPTRRGRDAPGNYARGSLAPRGRGQRPLTRAADLRTRGSLLFGQGSGEHAGGN